MSFGDLDRMGLAAFLQAETLTDELAVYIHIPKTAGSSISSELSANRPPYRNIHVTYKDNGSERFPIEMAVNAFIEEKAARPFRSCSGHFNMAAALRIREAFPDSRLVTILRDPVARVISDYRYQRTPAHPPYKAFIARFEAIEAYVRSRESQNKMAKFLSPQPGMPLDELMDFLDANMLFMGVLEMYPMSFNIMFSLLGRDAMPQVHKRPTEPTPDNVVDETPELRALIEELNPLDFRIYRHVRNRLKAHREEWMALRRGRNVRALSA